ncbi:MAG: DUF6519 domain-containing protein [Acidobacteriota bacterium]
MKGDFSRFTFVKHKHYSGVRMQQGRVQLDADWNEQLDISSYLRRTALSDIIGPHGTPFEGGGFEVAVDTGTDAISVAAGPYYVDGILIDNDPDGGAPVVLTAQPFLPGYAPPTADGRYVVYLDVFERHITALEDPQLLEPALGGPDTATRQQVVWQVRLALVASGFDCGDFQSSPPPEVMRTPHRLSARSSSQPKENQLYRVEIHDDSTATGGPTFKWSRDNGAVAARIDDPAANEIRISAQISQDLSGGFAAGQFVEVNDEARRLRGAPGFFATISTVEGQVLTVTWNAGSAPTLGDGTVLRRWEAAPTAVPAFGSGVALEDGVEVTFEEQTGGAFFTGDYWTIPGRAAAGVLWPVDTAGDPVAQDPQGVRHVYAPLAIVDRSGGAFVDPPVNDCRRPFQAVTVDPGDPKVSKTGDTMSGSLTIDADLTVNGLVTIAGGTGKLAMDNTVIEPSTGNSAERGIQFAQLSGAVATDEAYLRRFTSGALRKLVLGVGDSSNEILSLRQRNKDLVNLTGDGFVGIGTTAPTAELHVDVPSIRLEGSLFLLEGSAVPEAGQVLTVSDSTGRASWQDLPERQIGTPAFLNRTIEVVSGSGKRGWTTYEIDASKVPANVSAVILEAEGRQAGPDSGDVNTRLRIRKAPDEAELLLLRGRASGSGDSVAWAGQGIFPVRNGNRASFQYEVSNPGFASYVIRVVGYFP